MRYVNIKKKQQMGYTKWPGTGKCRQKRKQGNMIAQYDINLAQPRIGAATWIRTYAIFVFARWCRQNNRNNDIISPGISENRRFWGFLFWKLKLEEEE